jgi:hypothetical protein
VIEHDQIDHADSVGPLTGVPHGDIRGHLYALLPTLTLAELAVALGAQRAGRAWANEVCNAVETELAARVDGLTCAQSRTFIQLGLPRYLLVTTLKAGNPSPIEGVVHVVCSCRISLPS